MFQMPKIYVTLMRHWILSWKWNASIVNIYNEITLGSGNPMNQKLSEAGAIICRSIFTWLLYSYVPLDFVLPTDKNRIHGGMDLWSRLPWIFLYSVYGHRSKSNWCFKNSLFISCIHVTSLNSDYNFSVWYLLWCLSLKL